MEKLKRILSLPFLIGMPFVLLFANSEAGHQVWFTPLAYLFAFIGAGLFQGFGYYRTKPKNIGNLDSSGIKPDINQTWMIFFISLVINLTVANLF